MSARAKDLPERFSNVNWTEEEITLLAPYLRLPPSEQAPLLKLLPNRTEKGIAARIQLLRKRLGIKSIEHRWTKEEQEILQRHYNGAKTDYDYIAILLPGRTAIAVRSYCSNVRHKLEAGLYNMLDGPTFYPGLITCLSCRAPFDSWDKKRNRICDVCSGVNSHVTPITHSLRIS